MPQLLWTFEDYARFSQHPGRVIRHLLDRFASLRRGRKLDPSELLGLVYALGRLGGKEARAALWDFG